MLNAEIIIYLLFFETPRIGPCHTSLSLAERNRVVWEHYADIIVVRVGDQSIFPS